MTTQPMETNELINTQTTLDTVRESLASARNSAQSFASQAKSDNTNKGYQSDWNHFTVWCCSHGVESLPASSHTVALYIADAEYTDRPTGTRKRLKVSSLQRRIASISQRHKQSGFDSPTGHAAVRAVMAGIRRVSGTMQTQKAPTLKEDLVMMLAGISADTLIDVRDRALLLMGFGAALRRSELVSLNVEDIQLLDRGLIVMLRRSKTDQTGEGRTIAIATARNTDMCAATAVRRWMDRAGITTGPLFRSVNRHGHLSTSHLTGESVALIVKARVEAAGLDPAKYSGHSLRAGLATAAALAGASETDIARQTGHRSTAMLRKYIRIADVWRNNVTSNIL